MIAGKVWGTTELVEANGALEFHRIEMKKGGVCSKHLHRYKWNGFYVESGIMLIRTWQRDYDLVDETIVEAGDYHKVKPGLYHQFECIESGVAFELYWAEFNHNDIERENVGYHIDKDEEETIHLTPSTMYDETDFAGGSTLYASDGTSITIDLDEDYPDIKT
tara:strand:+ start:1833 stop:2321 length:489 start_codon:yes stop_codon:yes gene_type:complete